MVTVNKKIALNTGTATFELMGLSTDTKPTGTFSGYNVGENSVYLEMDTGKLYFFNGNTWEEMSMSGGGSGAGLPAVTSEDDGKVLGVVNGAWGKMDIGSGDEYETVAEIAVGQMQKYGELYAYGIPDGTEPPISDEDFASGQLYVDGNNLTQSGNMIGYNIDPQTMTVIAEPAIGFVVDGEAGERNIASVAASNDISNTTVTILKKVSGGETITVDDELSSTSENPVQNKVVTAALASVTPLVCDVSASGFDITVNDTPAELNAAWAANREIIIPVANIRLKMTECNYTDGTNYLFKFYSENPSTSTGILETYSLMFNDTMTATLDAKNYTPAT